MWQGVKPVDVVAPTVPESPAFALKQRMQRFAAQEPKQVNFSLYTFFLAFSFVSIADFNFFYANTTVR